MFRILFPPNENALPDGQGLKVIVQLQTLGPTRDVVG
jgi:hypothetical protein